MTRSPLVAALLSISFGFQLLLAAGGVTCVDADHGTMHAAAQMATDPGMTGMDMDMPMPTGDRDAPCDQPATPGACQLMGPCASSFIAIAVSDPDRPTLAAPRVAGPNSLPPLSRTFPPEPPPPRA